MRIAPILLKEELRLQDLYTYDILDSETEKEFNDLLEITAHICGCPVAAITFIDRDRHFFKAAKGIVHSVQEETWDFSFCSHTILKNEVMLVKDASQDKRFSENPNVTGGLSIRFYAGAPIISGAGYKLGSVCVIDSRPREIQAEEVRILTVISQQVAKLLELRLKNKLLLKKAEEHRQMEKQLLHRLLLEQENDFRHISTELHENIAQGLAATKFYLELAESSSLAQAELISKSRSNVETLVKQVRELSKSITPTTLRDCCLEELLQNLLSHFSTKTGIQGKLLYQGNRQVPPPVAMDIYRIAEEQLKNIQQHAQATAVVINITVSQCIHLSIKDNGVGVELAQFKKGVGIQKILSRVENLQGIVDISGTLGNGCELNITIPLPHAVLIENENCSQ